MIELRNVNFSLSLIHILVKENAERKAKENREKEEKVKEKRAAKKAEEEKAAKQRAEKSAERKETGDYTCLLYTSLVRIPYLHCTVIKKAII